MTLAEVGAGTLLMGDVKVGSLAFAEVGTFTYFLDVFGASIWVLDENGLIRLSPGSSHVGSD